MAKNGGESVMWRNSVISSNQRVAKKSAKRKTAWRRKKESGGEMALKNRGVWRGET